MKQHRGEDDDSEKHRRDRWRTYVLRYIILAGGLSAPWGLWWTLSERPLNHREVLGLATWPIAMIGAWAWQTLMLHGTERSVGHRVDTKREVRDYRIARWATTLSLVAVLWPKNWPREPSDSAQLWFHAWPVYLAVIWLLCTVMIRHYRRRAAELAEKSR